MKKWLIIALLSMLAVSTTVVSASISEIFEMVNYSIKVGDEVVKLRYSMYINGNRIYVSLRDICDKLGIPIEWNNDNREATMCIYNKKISTSDKTLFKEEGAIPDEETALIIGKTILEKYAGKTMEYETDKRTYYLRVSFVKSENAWIVVQNFKYKNPNTGGSTDFADFANVKLNKNTGEVIYINTHSTFTD